MTREEAIEFIAQSVKSDVDMAMIADAIKALSQEPCEDAISREAVLDAISRIGLCKSSANEVQAVKECLIATETLPSVTPQSKTVLYSGDGYADGYIVYDMAECPNCGYKYEDGDKDWRLPFCPNCGQSLDWESEDIE